LQIKYGIIYTTIILAKISQNYAAVNTLTVTPYPPEATGSLSLSIAWWASGKRDLEIVGIEVSLTVIVFVPVVGQAAPVKSTKSVARWEAGNVAPPVPETVKVKVAN